MGSRTSPEKGNGTHPPHGCRLIVSDLRAPGGILVISLRHGPDEANLSHPVSTSELIHHAQQRALVPELCRENTPDSYWKEITWDTLVFRLPDD